MPPLTGHMLYFAYGEDLPHKEFLKRYPGAEWFGPARLEGHRLVPNAAGLANIKTDSAATVWGSLWLVPAALLPSLDANAREGYERTTRRIVSPAGPRTEATVYLSTGRQKPAASLTHVKAIIEGARESRFPAAYIKELSSLGSDT